LLAARDARAEVRGATSSSSSSSTTTVGVDDEKYGKRLRAYIVRADGLALDEDDVKSYVKTNLARYKVPREVVFLAELPRNATGKVLKRELAEED